MSSGPGDTHSDSQKRQLEGNSTDEFPNKRTQKDSTGNVGDGQYEGLFDPLPFDMGDINETPQGGDQNHGDLMVDNIDGFNFDLPDFLDESNADTDPGNSHQQSSLNSPGNSSQVPQVTVKKESVSEFPSNTEGNDSKAQSKSTSPKVQKIKPPAMGSASPAASKSKSPVKAPKNKPEVKRATTVPSRFDEQNNDAQSRSSTPVAQQEPQQAVLLARSKTKDDKQKTNREDGGKSKVSADDASKLNDAIAAAGVDIQKEEELLAQQHAHRASNITAANQFSQRQRQYNPHLNAFLHPYHLAVFMNRVANQNGILQNFVQDGELLELMSVACQQWLSKIVSKTVILSRHRRRGIPSFNSKNKKLSLSLLTAIQRSDLSKELRNLAAKQKEMEEKRVSKRIILGLEKSADANGDASAKAGAEETLHRAANATAAMMAMNPGRKKYSWMTSSTGGGDDAAGGDKDGKNKQSSIISVRGDNGLRYREIRSGNSVTMKDLLGVIEEERMGTEKAVIKGYAKLKD